MPISSSTFINQIMSLFFVLYLHFITLIAMSGDWISYKNMPYSEGSFYGLHIWTRTQSQSLSWPDRTWTKWNGTQLCPVHVGPGGLRVTCSHRDPRFAGSNPTEDNGFFQDVKYWALVLREGLYAGGPESEISGSLKDLKPEKIDLRANFNRHIHVLVMPKFWVAQ